jgi:ADP-ribosylglycohydrolase
VEEVLKKTIPIPACLLIFLTCVMAQPPGMRSQDIPVAVVQDKVRGGLLGEMLGDLNGLEHEMKYIAEPGNVASYVPELPRGAWTDDDTDIEWIYVLEMQRGGELMVSPKRITELWKLHINRNIWCSHQYLRQLMEIGIEPPLTGRLAVNPWADFNLSGQFASETWGMISPGMPVTAARLGLHYTHVSIEGEPSQSAQMFAAMIATAYLTSDIQKILDAGEAALDPGSVFHRIISDVRRWHLENPGDWRASRKRIRDKYTRYGGRDQRDRNGVILNGASVIAALLYGSGDFTETVRHAFNFGWDCDNNAAMSGAILGVIKGHRWMMDQGWNIVDRYRNTSRDEMPMDETLTVFGDRMVALTDRVIMEQGGRRVTVEGEPVYRLNVEQPANLERLPDPKNESGLLQKNWKGEIETAIEKGHPDGLARAAYLAICLDLDGDIRRNSPGHWAEALAALQSQAKVMQALFYESPIPAGEALRAKAVAAGLVKPAQTMRLWTEK